MGLLEGREDESEIQVSSSQTIPGLLPRFYKSYLQGTHLFNILCAWSRIYRRRSCPSSLANSYYSFNTLRYPLPVQAQITRHGLRKSQVSGVGRKASQKNNLT